MTAIEEKECLQRIVSFEGCRTLIKFKSLVSNRERANEAAVVVTKCDACKKDFPPVNQAVALCETCTKEAPATDWRVVFPQRTESIQVRLSTHRLDFFLLFRKLSKDFHHKVFVQQIKKMFQLTNKL